MMNRHFQLSSEFTGAIAKKLPHAKKISFYTRLFLQSIRYIYIYKRASLACAARLTDTLCLPEAPFGRLGSHWLIIREISSLNISILVLKSIAIENSPNLSIFTFLMSNDDVITK